MLVFEDDESQQRLLRDLLEDEGHFVTVESSFAAGLDALREHAHELVVTDLQLSDRMVSFEELTAAFDGPVLLVAGHADRGGAREEDRVEVLIKPFDTDEFSAVVRRLLSCESARIRCTGRGPIAD